jgi:membrane protease YdiL (CAAX protease family)
MNHTDTYGERWAGSPARAGERTAARAEAGESQYSLLKIIAIWAAAVLPMVVLGWVVAPVIGDRVDLGVGRENREAFTRAGLLTIGLIWQFVLCMGIILREEGDLRWSTIRRRCWLNTPRDPKTGQSRAKLFWLLAPLMLLVVAIQMAPLADLRETAFPVLGEPERYSFSAIMESDDRKAALEGAWQVLGLFVVLGIFNTILGEELLFRGILLPKMRGTFGRKDWIANGTLFGLYHLHQPWSIPGSMLEGIFCEAGPSRRYRSAWFGIILHSGQTAFFIFVALGLVLGMA